MTQAIQIMKVPRLMENASKRLNYDRLEMTKILPFQTSTNDSTENYKTGKKKLFSNIIESDHKNSIISLDFLSEDFKNQFT
jgi:hypothetical protein